MSAVPPYAGQSQQTMIQTAAPSSSSEDGPSAMPPNPYPYESIEDWLPPAISQTDVYLAQGTFPL